MATNPRIIELESENTLLRYQLATKRAKTQEQYEIERLTRENAELREALEKEDPHGD